MKDKQAVARPVSLGSSAVDAILALPRETKRLIMATADAIAIPTALWAALVLKFDRLDPVLDRTVAYFLVAVGFGAVLLLDVRSVPGRHPLHGPEGHVDRDRRRQPVGAGAGCLRPLLFRATRSRCRRSPSSGRSRCCTSAAAASSCATCSCAASVARASRRRAWPSTARAMPARVSARSCSAARTSSRSRSSTTRSRCRAAASTACASSALEVLPQLVRQQQIERILLAMPSASRRRRREILTALEPLGVHVQSLPHLSDLICRQGAHRRAARRRRRRPARPRSGAAESAAVRLLHPRQVRAGDRRRRLDRLGAVPPDHAAGAEPPGAVRDVGARALQHRARAARRSPRASISASRSCRCSAMRTIAIACAKC